MTIGEEVAGPAGPKVLRLIYFVGAGFISVVAINKWRDLERKALLRKQQQTEGFTETSPNAVNKAVE